MKKEDATEKRKAAAKAKATQAAAHAAAAPLLEKAQTSSIFDKGLDYSVAFPTVELSFEEGLEVASFKPQKFIILKSCCCHWFALTHSTARRVGGYRSGDPAGGQFREALHCA